MNVPKTSDHIEINIQKSNHDQDPPVHSKALNQDLKDMDIFCTCIINIESRYLDHSCFKDQ